MKQIGILKHILIVTFFFILSFVLNKIPNGYIISGGDFYQLINIDQNLERYLYTWFNHSGQGQFNPLITTYPFYYIQNLLFNLGLSYSQIANFLIFQFLTLSFYSFYLSQKYLFDKINYIYIGPLFYSLNLTVITVLFYPWIITHHFLIYIFIPLIITFYITYLKSSGILNKEYLIFLLLAIISLPAYNNISFFFALLFIEGIIFCLLFLLNSKKNFFLTIKKGIIILLSQIIVSLIIILPFISSQIYYSNSIHDTKAFGGDVTNFILNTSSSPLNTFRGIIDDWRYPNSSLESKFNSIPYIFLNIAKILSIIFIFIIILGAIKKGKSKYDDTYFLLFITFLILSFLVNRLTQPFDSFNTFFYKELTLGLFRSPDKLFIFIPFFICYLITYFINTEFKNNKIIYYISIFGIFGTSLYIFTGGIVKQYEIDTNGYEQGIVKIPDEYFNIQKIINSDSKNTAILSLPYSVVNSLNWSNYQKWGYIGHDILHLLYNKNYIYSNGYDHPVLETKLSTEYFSKNNIDITTLILVIQKFGVEYIINHKDIEKQFQGRTKKNLEKLQNERIVKKISSNEYFDLYRVDKKYILPIIFSKETSFKKINPTQYHILVNFSGNNAIDFKQSHNPKWKLYLQPYSKIDCRNPNTYSGSLGQEKENYTIQASDDYQKIVASNTGVTLESLRELNPDINQRDLKIGQVITLKKSAGESYSVTECESENRFYVGGELSKLWEKPIFDDTHKMVYDYANQWTIDPAYIKANYSKEYYRENPDGSIDVRMTLYFKPQSYFYLGLMISGTTLILLLNYLGYDAMRNRKKKKSKI